jgi:hypothetical protein
MLRDVNANARQRVPCYALRRTPSRVVTYLIKYERNSLLERYWDAREKIDAIAWCFEVRIKLFEVCLTSP